MTKNDPDYFPAPGLVIPAIGLFLVLALFDPVTRIVKSVLNLDELPNLTSVGLAIAAVLTIVQLHSLYVAVSVLRKNQQFRKGANVIALLFGVGGAVFGVLLTFAFAAWL